MDIRRATPDEASDLVGLLVECWNSAYRGIVSDEYLDSLDSHRWEATVRTSLESGEETTCVAEQAGGMVGLVTFGPCRDADLDGAVTAEIWGLYVTPRRWRHGIGTVLCRHA